MPPDELNSHSAPAEHVEPPCATPPKRRRVVTDRMRAANAQNSRASSGPVSDAGKTIVAGNAVKHSLSSSGKMIERNHPERFEHHLQTLLERYQHPASVELRDKIRLLACAHVRMDLYIETQEAAVATARAHLVRNWSLEREAAARETLKRLDDPTPISPFIYRGWLTDYSIAREFQNRLGSFARTLDRSRAITPANLEKLLRLTGFTDTRLSDEALPEPLQEFWRDQTPAGEEVTLEDDQRDGLRVLVEVCLTELAELMELLEPREQQLMEGALACLDVFGESKELQLRYRYYRDAERALLRLTRELNRACPVREERSREPGECGVGLPREQSQAAAPRAVVAMPVDRPVPRPMRRAEAKNPFDPSNEPSFETFAAMRAQAPELKDWIDLAEARWVLRCAVEAAAVAAAIGDGSDGGESASGPVAVGHGFVSSNAANPTSAEAGHGLVSSNGPSSTSAEAGHGFVSSNGPSSTSAGGGGSTPSRGNPPGQGGARSRSQGGGRRNRAKSQAKKKRRRR